jgi:ribosomal protein L35
MSLKTRGTVAKRFVIKRSKKGIKLMKRTDGQDHFNSRESGKVKRNKRSDRLMSNEFKNTILKSIPNF